MNRPCRILICDDDDAVRSSLGFLLGKAGYNTNYASMPEEILRRLDGNQFDLILLDMNFSVANSGDEGLELLGKIKGTTPGVPVILITAWGSVELAVKGIKLGASDFITKPWNNIQLLKTVETSIALAQNPDVAVSASGKTKKRESLPEFSAIIGEDRKMIDILEIIKRVAPTHAPVLITGESGTGKEMIASAIHNYSARKNQPFIKVNLGGIPASLFESEMFGYKKGAYTDAKSDQAGRFEKAHKGSIFLDEIGDLNFVSQVKLLRVLQDQTFERLGDPHSITVDVRIISATNHDLRALVKDGSFREDLLYRINLIHVEVPPLRQRKDDIPLLASYFAGRATELYSIPHRILTGEAKEWLTMQPWPGNVRELRNVTERTMLLATAEKIRADDFIFAMRAGGIAENKAISGGTLESMEKQHILSTIEECGGNMTRAAERLGIGRATLYRKMEKHGIQIERNE